MSGEDLHSILNLTTNQFSDLKLRKAAIEKMSTMTNASLERLISGGGELDELISSFESDAKTWSDLSQMCCALSNNHEAIKLVKLARKQLEILTSYVTASARLLGSGSKEAAENMQVVRSRWTNQIDLLQLTIDDVICINDFLGE